MPGATTTSPRSCRRCGASGSKPTPGATPTPTGSSWPGWTATKPTVPHPRTSASPARRSGPGTASDLFHWEADEIAGRQLADLPGPGQASTRGHRGRCRHGRPHGIPASTQRTSQTTADPCTSAPERRLSDVPGLSARRPCPRHHNPMARRLLPQPPAHTPRRHRQSASAANSREA